MNIKVYLKGKENKINICVNLMYGYVKRSATAAEIKKLDMIDILRYIDAIFGKIIISNVKTS